MKRSKAIPLILLGTLLAGCQQEDEDVYVKQNHYTSKEDCHRDWGPDERNCKSHSSGGYIGPRYIWSHANGYPLAVESDGSTRPLPNSYLTKPGAATTSTGVTSHAVTVGGGSSAAGAGRAAGVSVARGGFGAAAHGISVSGGG